MGRETQRDKLRAGVRTTLFERRKERVARQVRVTARLALSPCRSRAFLLITCCAPRAVSPMPLFTAPFLRLTNGATQ